MTKFKSALTVAASLAPLAAFAAPEGKPNIIFMLADDIGVRELAAYGSQEWWNSEGFEVTSDKQFLAKTPIIDMMAEQGCYMETCWACPVSMPSRALLLTGRYAHIHKWWYNADIGDYINKEGKQVNWPIYESSDYILGTAAQQQGYKTFWAGKTQMPDVGNSQLFGFDEGCYTGSAGASQYTDFKLKRVAGKSGVYINMDTGKEIATFPQTPVSWKPDITLANNPHCSEAVVIWPDTPEAQAEYGLNTYGPDVEMVNTLDFVERNVASDTPFFIYHASHLGHAHFDFLNPDNPAGKPSTPKIEWDGEKYHRTEPNITGDNGVYDTHGTLSEPGMDSHVEYIDYMLWQYVEKLKELGEYENTIFIISGDNGTCGYGKDSVVGQKGVQVPLIIFSPGGLLGRQGEQHIICDFSDLLPTIADFAGAEIPEKYKLSGKSLYPYLMRESNDHRDYVYSYRQASQLIRGKKVMRDGEGTWYDVSVKPINLDKFPIITNWDEMSPAHRAERDMLLGVLPEFDLYESEYNAPSMY